MVGDIVGYSAMMENRKRKPLRLKVCQVGYSTEPEMQRWRSFPSPINALRCAVEIGVA
jgi:hypothetical protein